MGSRWLLFNLIAIWEVSVNRRAFENAIHRKLLEHGWRVQRAAPAPRGWEEDRAYWQPEYFRRLEFAPRTILDVGVGYGTPPLYAAYPDAYLVLVEPLPDFFENIRRLLAHRPGVHVPAAAGSAKGEVEMHVEPRFTERSSLYARHPVEQTGDRTVQRRFAVTTLDEITLKHALPEPYGLKIDAEGAELEVLRGAASTLRKTEFVIAEVSVLARFEGGYTFAQFIRAMDERGFEVCDVLGVGRANTSEITFLDLVFKRPDTKR